MLAAALPDLDSLDLEAMKAFMIAQHERYSKTLDSRATEIDQLTLLVAKLQHMLFGRKSEKMRHKIEQLELQIEDLVVATAMEEAQVIAPKERPAPAKPFRRPLPEHLPREVHTHRPGHEACPDCGARLRELGEDVAEMLEYVRSRFKVLRHVRPKLSCDACDRIVQAPAPSRPIDRGLAGPGLLALVLVSKYADHQLLYRQSEMYAREGVDLDRSTLAGWVAAPSELLTPLVEAVRDHVMAASKLHADDTPVPVLAPGNGKTKTGRLWTYVRDDRPSGDITAPAVWFAYSPDRKGERPREHLKLYSDTAAAIRYALTRWSALTRYIDDGQLEIDNNAAERALRVVALGRKNYLFAGSDSGGERAAAIYSLLGSAKHGESFMAVKRSRIQKKCPARIFSSSTRAFDKKR